jgi:hypothetical protein
MDASLVSRAAGVAPERATRDRQARTPRATGFEVDLERLARIEGAATLRLKFRASSSNCSFVNETAIRWLAAARLTTRLAVAMLGAAGRVFRAAGLRAGLFFFAKDNLLCRSCQPEILGI